MLLNQKFLLCPKFLKVGGGLKPNTNVPNADVPKWLRRGGVRTNWDNVLKSSFFFILKASQYLREGFKKKKIVEFSTKRGGSDPPIFL